MYFDAFWILDCLVGLEGFQMYRKGVHGEVTCLFLFLSFGPWLWLLLLLFTGGQTVWLE